MKRAGALSFLLLPLLIPAASLPAQSAQNAATSVFTPPPTSSGCPVAIRAQHGRGDGKNILLKNGQLPEIAQQLHLTFSSAAPSRIVGIQITVHGTNGKGGMVQAQADLANNPAITNQITRTLNLTLDVAPKDEAQLDLSLRSFTSVSQVDLDAISYADGSAWQASGAQACHFVPDGIMLIGR